MSCRSGHLEIVKWVVNLGADIYLQDNYTFAASLAHDHLQVAQYLYQLDNNLLPMIIKQLPTDKYSKICKSEQSLMLFELIGENKPFLELEDINDDVIISLAHYNIIDHLILLRKQFSFIEFDVIDEKIVHLHIDRRCTKSARSI